MYKADREKIIIDMNPVECDAMDAFLRGDSETGNALQVEFLKYLKEEMRSGKDHCPCTANCNLHGNCVMCVQVHRAHGNHLPVCLQPMVNEKLKFVSELTEHSLFNGK